MSHSPFRHIGSIFRKREPIHLTFFVTRRCNARCPYCFSLRSANPVTDAGVELSLDEIERVSRSTGPLLWLAFSGGEVSLREDIVEISRLFYRNSRPAIILYSTNGMLPETIRGQAEAILKSCPDSVLAVKLSLDDIGAEHDAIRNTPGSFERVMETCRLLGELQDRHPRFELGINTVFSSENQDRMEKIITFVGKMPGIRTHTVSLVRGGLTDERYKNIDSDKYLRTIMKIEGDLRNGRAAIYRFRGARLKAAQDILQRRLIHRTMKERKRLIPCYAGRLNLVLAANGDVFPCEILSGRFGNVREFGYDLRRVRQSDEAQQIIASIEAGKCHCTHECNFMMNILFNPRMYPALLREYVALLRKTGNEHVSRPDAAA